MQFRTGTVLAAVASLLLFTAPALAQQLTKPESTSPPQCTGPNPCTGTPVPLSTSPGSGNTSTLPSSSNSGGTGGTTGSSGSGGGSTGD